LALLTIVLTLTLGTVILVILGEIIEKKGIGKGISIIILAGILMTLPDIVVKYFTTELASGTDSLFLTIVKAVLLLTFIYTLLLSIIIVNGGERKIPIQQAQQDGQYGRASRGRNFLPIKINASGVIPVIFASALFMLPIT